MFGTKEKKSKKYIGLYVSLDNFYLSQSIARDGRIKVEKFVKIPVSKTVSEVGMHTSAMNVEFFSSEEHWLEPLRNAIGKLKPDTKDIVVTLSPAFAVIRHFAVPFVERRFWRQSVPFEAKKYVPFAFEDSVYDYFVYVFKDEKTGINKLGVIFGLTNKKISQAIATGISKIGLNLSSVEVSAISAQRFFNVLDKEKVTAGVCRAHFDAGNAYFLLSNNSMPLLFRVVKFAQSQISERRRLGLGGSVDFIHKQLGSEIYKEINVSGDNLEFWKNIIKEDTKLKIKIWQPDDFINMKNTDWGTYVSLGAGAKASVEAVSDIDLRPNIKRGVVDKMAVSFLWKIAGATTLVFLCLFAYYQAKLFYARSAISRASKGTQSIAALEKLSAGEIESYINDMQSRLRIISSLSDKIDYFIPKLEAVVNTIPDQAWLKNITYLSPVQKTSRVNARSSFILNGYLSAKNQEINLANEFKDKFQNEPEIEDVYSGTDGKVKIEYRSS
ncbi:MAG TPA: hypothetical protein VMW66_03105, partial [Elusimicrobiales bacterium]|nr:hypothetical protein [Elusimicrobiales bacterium]